MSKKFISAVMAAALLAGCLGSCGKEIETNTDVYLELTTNGEDITSDDESAEHKTAPVPVIVEVKEDEKSYSEVKITPSEIKYTAFDETYQAEDGAVSGNAVTADSRKGFKEKGYVTNITAEDEWKLTFKVPASQFYNLTLTSLNENTLRIDTDDKGQQWVYGVARGKADILAEVEIGGFTTSKTLNFTVMDERDQAREENRSSGWPIGIGIGFGWGHGRHHHGHGGGVVIGI